MDKETIAELANSVNDVVAATSRPLNQQIAKLKAELEKHRWIPTDEPPDNMDSGKKVQVLEYESEIPTIMTMAEVFLDEGSEAEYWKPIILPCF